MVNMELELENIPLFRRALLDALARCLSPGVIGLVETHCKCKTQSLPSPKAHREIQVGLQMQCKGRREVKKEQEP